jgi:hypothetical protein
MQRRKFLSSAIATSIYLPGFLLLNGSRLFGNSPLNLTNSKRRHLKIFTPLMGQFDRNALMILEIDVDTLKYSHQIIETGRLPHITLGLDKDFQAIAVMPQRPGPQAWIYELDGNSYKKRSTIDAGKDRYFYGHGAANFSRKSFFATEFSQKSETGRIVERSIVDFKIINEFSSGGIGPHDLCFFDSKTLIVANGGFEDSSASPTSNLKSSIAVLDIEQNRVITTLTLPASEVKTSLRHFSKVSDHKLAIGVDNRRVTSPVGNVGLLDLSLNKVSLVSYEKQHTTEFQLGNVVSLSVAIDPHRKIAYGTHPSNGVFSVWGLEDGKLIFAQKLNSPSGVSYNDELDATVLSDRHEIFVQFGGVSSQAKQDSKASFHERFKPIGIQDIVKNMNYEFFNHLVTTSV